MSEWEKKLRNAAEEEAENEDVMYGFHLGAEWAKGYLESYIGKTFDAGDIAESSGGYMSVDRVQAFRNNWTKIKEIVWPVKK